MDLEHVSQTRPRDFVARGQFKGRGSFEWPGLQVSLCAGWDQMWDLQRMIESRGIKTVTLHF